MLAQGFLPVPTWKACDALRMKSSLVVQHCILALRDNLIPRLCVTLTPSILSLCVVFSTINTPAHELANSRQESETSLRSAATPTGKPDQTITSDQVHVALLSEIIEDSLPSHPLKESIAHTIVVESRKAQIDPLFVAAVVQAESTFKTKAVSNRGARGLMQIMPTTARHIAKLLKVELKNSSELHNPETNIKLGVWYLKHLFERFKGDREQALVAYNWGPSNVLRAISSGAAYPEISRSYARKVLGQHGSWIARLNQYAANKPSVDVG